MTTNDAEVRDALEWADSHPQTFEGHPPLAWTVLAAALRDAEAQLKVMTAGFDASSQSEDELREKLKDAEARVKAAEGHLSDSRKQAWAIQEARNAAEARVKFLETSIEFRHVQDIAELNEEVIALNTALLASGLAERALQEALEYLKHGAKDRPVMLDAIDKALSTPPSAASVRAEAVLRTKIVKRGYEYWLEIPSASINLGMNHGPIVTRALEAALEKEGAR